MKSFPLKAMKRLFSGSKSSLRELLCTSNFPLARPNGIGSIVEKSVHNARELQSIVHLDCDPLNIPSCEKKCNLGVDILSDTTIISIRVAGRQYGTMWVTDEVSLGKKNLLKIYLLYLSYICFLPSVHSYPGEIVLYICQFCHSFDQGQGC